MANSWQKMAVLAMAGLLSMSAMLNGAQASCGGFAASCSGTTFSGSVLSASCSNTNGQSVSSSLDLNPFLSNNNGNLVQGSGFAASCTSQGTGLIGSEFYVFALCRKEDGTSDNTSYDVQNNVVNNDGTLAWNNCRRRSLLESTAGDAAHEKLANQDRDHSALGGRKMLH